MNKLDLMLARAQVTIVFITLLAMIVLVTGLIFLHTQMDTIVVTIVTSLLSVMTTVFVLQQNFMFARQRPQALPDPTPIGDPNAKAQPNAPSVTATITASPAVVASGASSGGLRS